MPDGDVSALSLPCICFFSSLIDWKAILFFASFSSLSHLLSGRSRSNLVLPGSLLYPVLVRVASRPACVYVWRQLRCRCQ